jgi:hypothetical protein
MFFFDDNAFVLRKGDPIGERVAKIAKEKGILLMICDACALERNLAKGELRWCNPDGTGRTTPGDCVPYNTVEGRAGGLLPRPLRRLSGQPTRPSHLAIALRRKDGATYKRVVTPS